MTHGAWKRHHRPFPELPGPASRGPQLGLSRMTLAQLPRCTAQEYPGCSRGPRRVQAAQGSWTPSTCAPLPGTSPRWARWAQWAGVGLLLGAPRDSACPPGPATAPGDPPQLQCLLSWPPALGSKPPSLRARQAGLPVPVTKLSRVVAVNTTGPRSGAGPGRAEPAPDRGSVGRAVPGDRGRVGG